MIPPEIQNFVIEEIKKAQKNSLYSISNAAYHTHNGIDSPKLDIATSSKTTTGQADRSLGGSTTTQTIAHGFGSTPSYFRITGFTLQGGVVTSSIGTYNGTTMYFVSVTSGAPNWGSGYVVNLTADGVNFQSATVTLDATNINLAWTKTGTGASGTLHFIWECS